MALRSALRQTGRLAARRSWTQGGGLAAAGLITALGCVLFAPALFGGRVLSPSAWIQFTPPFAGTRPANLTRPPNLALHDNTILFEDHLFVARSSVTAGRSPLWDPSIGAGRPLGGQQGAPFFITSWLAYLLPFWHALAWIALAKLLLSGVGLALFCRSLDLARGPSMLAALAMTFSNLFIAFLGHGQTAAFALLPWALLAAERLVLTTAPRWGAAFGLAVGLAAYNGHPESFFLMAGLSGLYLAFRLLARQHVTREGAGRCVSIGAAGIALAGVLAAFALVSLIETLGQSMPLVQPAAEHGSLRDLLLGTLMPEFWGRPDKVVFNQTATPIFTAVYYGRPYLGVIPCLLAATGLLRRPTVHQWFFLALASVATLLTLGGPARQITHNLPGLSQVNPFEYLWPLSFALAVLAAFGAQRLVMADRTTLRRGTILVALAAIITVSESLHLRSGLVSALGSGLRDLPTLRPGERSAEAAAAGAMLRALLLCGLTGGALVLVARRPSRRHKILLVLVGVSAIDLVLLAHGWWPMPPRSQVAPPAPPSLQTARAAGPLWRVAALEDDFSPDLAERYGVADARLVDLPELSRYTDLFTGLGGSVAAGFGESIVTRTDPGQLKLLDLLAVRWLFDRGAGQPASGLHVVSSRPGDRLLENPAALPRAYVAYGSRAAADPSAALRLLAASPVSALYRAPVIEGAPSTAPVGSPTPVAFTINGTTRVRLSFTAQRPGWLILDDTYFPGWHATVDQRAVRILPADGAFRAIPVPAGHHVAAFTYAPSAEIGAGWLSIVALVGTILGLAASAMLRRDAARGLRSRDPRADAI